MKLTRRNVLRGAAGVALGLPVLESFAPRRAFAQDAGTPPFAIFFRQANGIQQGGQNSEIGREPERFWPRTTGAITPDGIAGRTVEEIGDFRDALLLTKVNMRGLPYGDGHARGAMQGLTAAGPMVDGAGGSSEASGESLDHRIGRELNPEGRDSLFMYAGRNQGWLGGACVSYRGPGRRRAALHNPWNAYQSFVSDGNTLPPETQAAIAARGQSVNDLIRDQMQALLSHPRLSTSDRRRLQLHQQTIRDLEVSLTCRLAEDRERALQQQAPGFDSTNGDEVLATARLHMDVAALAVACGYTRSVTIQVGNGNDGLTRYRNPETGSLMENFHYVSHRRLSHGADGQIIEGSDILHHYVDRQFAQTFRHLLERLSAYQVPTGGRLLDTGMAIWYNDLGDGPPHSPIACPFVIAGSAGGQLRQGVFVDLSEDARRSDHRRLLNTIGAAAGVQEADGSPLSTFGQDIAPPGRLDALLA
jgi:hypothetical protein